MVMALFTGAACVLQAASEEDVCADLQAGLQRQVELLLTVKDAAGAEAVLAPLRENMSALAALNGRVPQDRLWLYIDNSPQVKAALIEQLQRLSVELQRLETGKFFGCAGLRSQLAPMVKGAAGAR